MAAEKTKRPLPAKVMAMQARKRQKLDNGSLKNKGPAPKVATKTKVRLDDLKWTEVAMPDRLEDVEGFYGLEEIDDVDVIKDGHGTISFAASGESKANSNHDGAVDVKDGDEGVKDGDEEFAGFSDDEKSNVKPLASEKPTKKKAKTAPKDSKQALKPTKEKSTAPAHQSAGPGDAAFTDMMEDVKDEGVDIAAWRELDLSPDTLSSLSRMKFSKPTPIQSAAIPEIVAGHDVIGKASTGSGKTLAFGIPIFERFLELQQRRKEQGKKAKEGAQKPPVALILSPTRELAHQISTHLTDLCAGMPTMQPSIATLTGGLSVQKQQRLLKTADVIIGTPGRLWEVISEGHGIAKWLKQIHFLVLDEADRLLSTGHFKELEEILNILEQKDEANDDAESDDEEVIAEEEQRPRQTLVFSATFHKGLQQKLAGKSKFGSGAMDKKESMEYLLAKLKFQDSKPKYVDVNPTSQMATGLKEGLVECAGTEKDLYLYSLLLMHRTARTLVFANSISAVRRLTPFLQNLALPALALHSQMPQKARMRSIERFSAAGNTAKGSILVSTDVAARGLDIANVQLVIHYHLPRAADAYVHRSGRTARAGQPGSSILICGPEEVAGVRRLVGKVHAGSATVSDSEAARQGYFIRTLDIDRRVVARLKPRATLAKQLADVVGAKEKKSSEDDFLRQAAEDLGVEYDSEEFEKPGSGKRGRGAGRMKKEREARGLTKDEVRGLRFELNQLLKQRVNVGVSERYLTSGSIDIEELLRQEDGARGEFLGTVQGIGMDN